VFARRGGFSGIKRQLDAAMRPDAPWRTHDLRRTAASGMQALGIDVAVIEKVLGHKGATFRGIVSVYQQHDYAAEKRAALQRWADHLDALVRGESAVNVIAFAAGR
jgi:integrase